MQKLVSGVTKFQDEGFAENQELFQTLANGQEPEALLITCADSRIDPNLITQTKPGDLFIIRNAGNIVPPHTMATGGVTASIEFAVKALNVQHIVICGHTDCGAVKGAIRLATDGGALPGLPHVTNWLCHCSAAVEKVRSRQDGELGPDQLLEVTQENVLLQLKHLETHPSVAARLESGQIELHGWVYDIGNGRVICHDAGQKAFVPVEDRYSDLLKETPQAKARA